MNVKTIFMALGVAAVLLVAGLATVFYSTPLSGLMRTSDNNDAGSSGVDSGGSNGITSPGTTDQDSVVTPALPSEPIPTNDESKPAEVKQGEPSLWMEYTTNWDGDSISYGMPYPGANRFTVETNEYGEDQPEGQYRITHFIHISNVAPRSGNLGDPEGSVEIRTHNPNSQISRLVNLYDDGKGGCYGILVDTFATWDYTWTYEHGKSVMFTQTFSVNITKLGSHTIDVYAIHDHGDGAYKVVSNHLTRTFTTYASSVIDARIGDRLGNYLSSGYYVNRAIDFQVTAERGTYESNIHGRLPYAYSHTVNIKLFIEGTGGHSLRSGTGSLMTGVSTSYVSGGTTLLGTMYELGSWNVGGQSSADHDLSVTFTDGKSHQMYVIVTDVPSGEIVGLSSAWFWNWT